MEREKEHQIRMERKTFSRGAAHELRTPLTLILAPLQELMKQYNPLEPFYKKLQVMYKNATSLHHPGRSFAIRAEDRSGNGKTSVI